MFGTEKPAFALSGLLVINYLLNRALPYPVAYALTGHFCNFPDLSAALFDRTL